MSKSKQLVTMMTCAFFLSLGCQNLAKNQKNPDPLAAASVLQPENTEKMPTKFSLGQVFRSVAFWQRRVENKTEMLSTEMIELGDAVDMIVAKTSDLNITDPPEMTRQKAQEILNATQSWDSLVAGGRSVGLINETNVSQWNQFITAIRTECNKIVQHGPNPQTIVALQQLATGLSTSFQSLSTALTQGIAAYHQL